MRRIVLATAAADLQLRLEQATDGTCVTLPLGPLPPTPQALLAQLDVVELPDVIVLDAGMDPHAAIELASGLSRECPGASVVLVSDIGAEIGLDAMRAGIRDILDPEADVPEIRTVLERAGDAARTRPVPTTVAAAAPVPSSGSSHRVISVVSPKGGVGKTTVATNLAVGLAGAGDHSVVLVDLDLQFGDVASALNLDPEHSVLDTIEGPATRDTMVLKTFLTLHETGLYVICGPGSPAAADLVTADQISHLLQMLASEFSYVVVDTAPGLSEHVLAAMDESTDLVAVTSMDVPGLRGLRKELGALTELEMLTDSCCVVLNFADPRAGLTVADAEATIGAAVDLTLPRSKATPRSVNQGVPLLQSGVRDPVTKELRRLVKRFAPVSVDARQSSWLRGRREPKVAVSADPPARRAAPLTLATRNRHA